MNNMIKYDEIIKNNTLIKGSKLIIDKIYAAQPPATNMSHEILPKLMGVKNQGGFRYIGDLNKGIKYVVLFTTGNDPYWQDKLDEELGMFTYYGDNKQPGKELHNTSIHGNEILRSVFLNSCSNELNIRKKIPPFFLFSRTKRRDVKFLGLLIPGYKSIPQNEWLVALWAKRNEGGRFQNYKALFTVLNIDEGCEYCMNDASIDLRWLEDLKNGKGYESLFTPIAWKRWINSGKYNPLITKIEKRVRSRTEQLPTSELKGKLLKFIIEYFSKNRETQNLFEKFAIYISLIADGNIVSCDNTRPSRDGGRDAVGTYRIMSSVTTSVTTEFALEAKCYSLSNSVGVKETSRLISRIKHREFGIFVTTSYISNQAYEEIIIDNHPIIIITGGDIINLLWKVGVISLDLLKKFLTTEFPTEQSYY